MQEIRSRDLPKGNAKPRIKIGDNAKLLNATAYSTTGDGTGKLHESSKNELAFEFDYLNHNDTIIGEVYFSNCGEVNYSFLGSVKGSKLKKGRETNESTFDIVFHFTLCIVLFSISFPLFGIVFSAFVIDRYIAGILLSIINCYLVFSAFGNAFFGFKAIRNRIPKDYSDFLMFGINSKIGELLHSEAFHYSPSRM